MAVPARKLSKAKKNRRRGSRQFEEAGRSIYAMFSTRSHHVSLKEYTLKKPIITKAND